MDTQTISPRPETAAERIARENLDAQRAQHILGVAARISTVRDQLADVIRQQPPLIEWRDCLQEMKSGDRKALAFIVDKLDALGDVHYSVRDALKMEQRDLNASLLAYANGPFENIMDIEARAAVAGITRLPNRATITGGRLHLNRTIRTIEELQQQQEKLTAQLAELEAAQAVLLAKTA